VKPLWTNAVFGEAISHFKLKRFVEAKKCITVAINNFDESDCMESIHVLEFIKAMCDKNLGNY